MCVRPPTPPTPPTPPPHPVRQASDGVSLRTGLLDDSDYELVPAPAWELLVKWYGAGSGPASAAAVEGGDGTSGPPPPPGSREGGTSTTPNTPMP